MKTSIQRAKNSVRGKKPVERPSPDDASPHEEEEKLKKQGKEKKKTDLKKRSERLKSLFPNPWQRTLVNLVLIAGGGIVVAGQLIKKAGQMVVKPFQRKSNKQIKKFGLDTKGKNAVDGQRKKYEFAVSPNAGTELVYQIIASKRGAKQEKIEGYMGTLTDKDNKKTSLFIPVKSTLNKDNVSDLLHGRSINTGGNKWVVPDLNDRDAKGNIKLKEVEIQQFNVRDALKMKFGTMLNHNQLDQLATGLQSGKRVDTNLKVDGKIIPVQLEVSPIARSFRIYDANGNKMMLENLRGKTSKSIATNQSKNKVESQKQPKVASSKGVAANQVSESKVKTATSRKKPLKVA